LRFLLFPDFERVGWKCRALGRYLIVTFFPLLRRFAGFSTGFRKDFRSGLAKVS
jgi:hypothetical protein